MSRGIPLTQGRVAIVDENLYDWLNQWKWLAEHNCQNDTYCASRHDPHDHNKHLYMHRLIMNAPAGTEVDHINHDKLDNRVCNLRICTKDQNQWNTLIRKDSTSGYKGVCWHKASKRWSAYIRYNNIRIHLGLFDSPIEAAQAYNKAAVQYHGEYAYLNTIPQEDKVG